MKTPISIAENIDCMEFMKQYPDKFFELAIVDPPYGLGDAVVNSGGRFKRYENNNGNWDMFVPTIEYFEELKRVSVNQIIWGGNYFERLGATRGFIIWDKQQPQGVSFASCEFAWSSFDCTAKTFYLRPQGQENRFHPTQKPIALYTWLLQNYAKKGDKILDTHLGSQSSRIAAYKLGFDFYGCEIDKDYYEQGNERFKKAIAEPLFDAVKEPEQGNIFTAAEYFEPNIFERKG
jgi:site-specific DNA-methyltransferase (adenine-specific)